MDAIEVLEGIWPLLRRRTREAMSFALCVVVLLLLRWPSAPALAPARWAGCWSWIAAVEIYQDRIYALADDLSTELKTERLPVRGPSPWCDG
jgi:hypothetical protein